MITLVIYHLFQTIEAFSNWEFTLCRLMSVYVIQVIDWQLLIPGFWSPHIDVIICWMRSLTVSASAALMIIRYIDNFHTKQLETKHFNYSSSIVQIWFGKSVKRRRMIDQLILGADFQMHCRYLDQWRVSCSPTTPSISTNGESAVPPPRESNWRGCTTITVTSTLIKRKTKMCSVAVNAKL